MHKRTKSMAKHMHFRCSFFIASSKILASITLLTRDLFERVYIPKGLPRSQLLQSEHEEERLGDAARRGALPRRRAIRLSPTGHPIGAVPGLGSGFRV